MKKTLLLTIVCLSLSAFSQKGTFKINVVAGLNIAFPVGPDAKQDRADMKELEKEYSAKDGGSYSGSIDPRFGFHFGGTIDYFITEKFAATSGLLFSQRGYSTNEKYEYNATFPVDYKKRSSERTTVNLDYLDLPIFGKYFLTNTFYVNAGLQFCFLASDSWIENSEYNTTEYVNGEYKVVDKSSEERSSAYAKGILTGIHLGVGMSKEKLGVALGISKTGVPLSALGISFGYPNLLLQLGLSYKVYTKNK